MAGKIQTFVRTVRGLTEDERLSAFEDPHELLSFAPCKLKTYRENPYLKDLDQPCQLIGVKDGRVIGRRNSFPSRIVADGIVYDTRISGSVYVDPAARSSLYAISLLNQALKFPDGDLNINCYLSVQNQKFYRLFGSAMFRFLVFEAGGRWSLLYRRGSYVFWKCAVIKFINFLVAVANHFFDISRWRGGGDWHVEEVDIDNIDAISDYCEMVKADMHKYRQEITPEWIRWTVSNDFYANDCRKYILRICDGKETVGFALIRKGLKTKTIRIYEWQISNKYQGQTAEFLSLVAKTAYGFGYKVQIPIAEDNIAAIMKLKERFIRSESNYVVVTIAKGSRFETFSGIRESKNWRVRPGMGDASLW